MEDQNKLSYALGMNVAQSLKNQGLEVSSPEEFARAMSSVINGEGTDMTPDQAMETINAFMQKIAEAAGSENQVAGEKFLAENKGKEGVTTTDSGLQYEVLASGDGATPGPTDQVTTHYHGTLISGKVFDSSVERGQPASFGVNQVIAGWTEALQLMKEGDKWRLFVPSNLAYGARGAGADIGPNSTLIFEVELLKVN